MNSSQSSDVLIHVRRLLRPSDQELAGVLRVMRLAFASDPLLQLVLAGDLSPARVDGLHACYIRSGLIEGTGELWVAEAERSDAPDEREIVGQALWLVPGGGFLADESGRAAVKWDQYGPIFGERQERWFLDYYLPRLAAFWAHCVPPPAESSLSAYRLSKLSVLPGYHNLGVASLLVWPVLDRAGREGRRALGQATSEQSRHVYERTGCIVLGAEDFWPLPLGEGQPAEEGKGSIRLWAIEIKPQELLGDEHWDKARTDPVKRVPAKL
ncbi:hypothetical protein CALVIDRAFT_597185 [Calocera viscosa TUFC12733]|uniref:N-acetyltransferase domain-containing protein n=1 Tax=Calocera viscosa (strain TUFC12733) TaxID=1330018 RepID=A0A167NGQ7_CALVF|nr:hypothetical protein CALVIDRAFT_597185 [Calocera viscosa TUFC12733]